MTSRDRADFNISQTPVAGIGGAGLIVMVGAVAVALPEARAFMLLGLAGGLICAAALLARDWFAGPVDAERKILVAHTDPNAPWN